MPLFRRNLSASSILLLISTAFTIASALIQPQKVSAQTQAPTSAKPARHDSIEVTAKLSPEEVEDEKLNAAYEPLSEQVRKGACSVEVVEQFKSKVIPLAEKSTLNKSKNKFLFLANRDIGTCYLAQQKFGEAEASLKKSLQYAPVWPGITDSDYPITFRQIAKAQMGSERWEGAEASLNKSVSIFDGLINQALKSDDEFNRTERAGSLRGSKAISLVYLGGVYLREGHTADALKTAEIAFTEATRPNTPARYAATVAKIGRSIAEAIGDRDAIAKWSGRS